MDRNRLQELLAVVRGTDGNFSVRVFGPESLWDVLRGVLRRAERDGQIAILGDLQHYPFAFSVRELPEATGGFTDLLVVQQWLLDQMMADIQTVEDRIARLLARNPRLM